MGLSNGNIILWDRFFAFADQPKSRMEKNGLHLKKKN